MPTKDRSRIRELNQALQVKAKAIEDIGNAFNIDDQGNVSVSTEQRDALLKAVSEAEEIKGLIEIENKRGGIDEFLTTPETTPAAATEAAATASSRHTEAKSLADMWFGSREFQEVKDSGFTRFGQTFSTDRGIETFAQAKDIYSSMAGEISIPALGSPQNLGLTPRMLRPGRVRDLFPSETTTANLLYGIRETGFTNRAAIVPERTAADGGPATGGPTDVYGLKPRSDLTITPVTYPLATIN